MILVAFLLPVAVYLLILGWVNRQSRPFVVPGTWDFIGLLFACSGFLLLGGPAALSTLNERWRLFWLLGEAAPENLDPAREVWVILAVAYFALVVGGCAWTLWRRRQLTAIYNVDPAVAEKALIESCEFLGLEPIRSGNLFIFGLTLEGPAARPSPPAHPGIQAPHALPGGGVIVQPATGREEASLAEEMVGQNAVLELEPFAAMNHVTLRWDPPHSPLRPVLETEMARRMARRGRPDHDAGTWLSLAGFTVLGVAMMMTFLLILRALLIP